MYSRMLEKFNDLWEWASSNSATYLLSQTKKHFHFRNPSSQTQKILKAAREMLDELKVTDPDFDQQYDRIVVGAMILAMTMEDRKYGRQQVFNNEYLYPKRMHELQEICGVPSILGIAMLIVAFPEEIKNFIQIIGKKVLEEKMLPFSGTVRADAFPDLAGIIPAARFAKYELNNSGAEIQKGLEAYYALSQVKKKP